MSVLKRGGDMQRRSKGGKPRKRRRAPGPKIRKAPIGRVLPDPTELDRLKIQRNEARDQLAATSEVLRVISNSPGELEPVFRATLEQATRVCDAKFGIVFGTNAACFTRWLGLMCRPPFMISLSRKARLLPNRVSCLAVFASQKR